MPRLARDEGLAEERRTREALVAALWPRARRPGARRERLVAVGRERLLEDGADQRPPTVARERRHPRGATPLRVRRCTDRRELHALLAALLVWQTHLLCTVFST